MRPSRRSRRILPLPARRPPADLFANYLSANDTGTHTIARTLTASVKTYYEAVKDGLSSNAQIKALQDAALTQAMSDLRTGTRTGLATVTAAVVAKASADTASQRAATQDVDDQLRRRKRRYVGALR